jgi:hypothetical protein
LKNVLKVRAKHFQAKWIHLATRKMRAKTEHFQAKWIHLATRKMQAIEKSKRIPRWAGRALKGQGAGDAACVGRGLGSAETYKSALQCANEAKNGMGIKSPPAP